MGIKLHSKDKPGSGRWRGFATRALIRLAGLLLRLLHLTYREEVINPEAEDEFFVPGKGLVTAVWHRCAIILPLRYRRLRPATMVSSSRDGELLALFLASLGATCFRGSSTRKGLKAFIGLEKHLKTHGGIASTAADGPTGPPFVAKPGLIALASRTGLPLISVVYSADRAWELSKAWDKTLIPKPFARVKIMFGRAFTYKSKLTPEELEAARLELEEDMNRCRLTVERLCGKTSG